jgi:hypothetical protein
MTQSLRDFDNLADRIRLHRQVRKTPLLIVEGVTDKRLLERLLNLPGTDIFIASTRQVALDVAKRLTEYGVGLVAAVVDRDFDDTVAQAEANGLPVVAYDGADLESMLLTTSALDTLLSELARPERLQTFGGVEVLRAHLQDEALAVAGLRRANALHRWGLAFDEIDLASKVDRDTLRFRLPNLCDALRRTVQNGVPERQALIDSAGLDPGTCPRSGHPLRRGRDCLALLAAALRRRIGSLNHHQAEVDHLERLLRMATTHDDIEETAWLSALRAAISTS